MAARSFGAAMATGEEAGGRVMDLLVAQARRSGGGGGDGENRLLAAAMQIADRAGVRVR